MAAIVGCPEVAVSVDAQTMWVGEKPLANALHKIALFVILGQHRLGSLEQKNVALRIHRDGRSFARNHAFGEFEKVSQDTIRQFRNGLERAGGNGRYLGASMPG